MLHILATKSQLQEVHAERMCIKRINTQKIGENPPNSDFEAFIDVINLQWGVHHSFPPLEADIFQLLSINGVSADVSSLRSTYK